MAAEQINISGAVYEGVFIPDPTDNDPTSDASLLVRPPFEASDAFYDTYVAGKKGVVNIDHIVTTVGATLLNITVESPMHFPDESETEAVSDYPHTERVEMALAAARTLVGILNAIESRTDTSWAP